MYTVEARILRDKFGADWKAVARSYLEHDRKRAYLNGRLALIRSDEPLFEVEEILYDLPSWAICETLGISKELVQAAEESGTRQELLMLCNTDDSLYEFDQMMCKKLN